MAESVIKYTSIANIKDFWTAKIAPNYWDMTDVNQYNVGLFGYVNEVMAEVTEDSFNAISIARREFYPITARYKKTLYKMATMQRIDLPVSKPATCKAALIIPEQEILDRAKFSNGNYTCVIDNSAKILADITPFMLDYPIIIISKKAGSRVGDVSSNGWIHTCHYDTTVNNSLSGSNASRYIVNKVIIENGVRYLALFVTLRQVSLDVQSKPITKDTSLETVTMDFNFTGDLASFEVFYKENDASPEVQLKKVPINGSEPTVPFCFYEYINSTKIRLTFTRSAYFTPVFNSDIYIYIYTSLGSGGNFKAFKGSLVTQLQSEKYPYNNTMTITGLINGSSSGGLDKPTDEEFRQYITDAYSTNNTITTSSDLQIYFNSLMKKYGSDETTKILFRKKRDDALIRLFGAYILLKDEGKNVIPTNTLHITMKKSQIVTYAQNSNRMTIKPGTLFEYDVDPVGGVNYDGKIVEDLTLMDDLTQFNDNSRFIFANPFLIGITLNPNIIGYYMNSLNVTRSLEYTYVNDAIVTQFIASSLRVDRNAFIGENYYRISMTLSPSSELNPSLLIVKNNPLANENRWRATKDGKIMGCIYDDTAKAIICSIKYVDDTTDSFQVSNTVQLNAEGAYEYTTGYEMQFNVGEKFTKGDVLGIKNDTDLGRLRIAGDIVGTLYENDLYFPLTIEHYDEEFDTYEVAGYLSTGDLLTLEAKLLIEHGIYRDTGDENDNVTIPMNKDYFAIHTFYLDDTQNTAHKYDGFKYFKGYTLTNSYQLNMDEEDYVSLVQQIDFVRSVISYLPNSADEQNWIVDIDEMPLVKASWCKTSNNFKYLIDKVSFAYAQLYETYFLLENNFGIDLKFYNTYGKAKFFKIGIQDEIVILDSVNCSISFGIYLTSLTSSELFLQKFREYVKNYVESINYDEGDGQSIYIFNLTNDIYNNFPEIGYLEYYGVNKYDYKMQKIESMSNTEILSQGIRNYIPEFINIRSATSKDGKTYPEVNVNLLDK